MDDTKDQGFTIRDRRTAASDASEDSAARGADSSGPQQADSSKTGQQQEPRALPDVDFSSFILSLAASAQISLGLAPDPQSNLTAQNLPAAKQMIDLLGMLKDKTKGNLGKEEQELLDMVLANLRILYVKIIEGKK